MAAITFADLTKLLAEVGITLPEYTKKQYETAKFQKWITANNHDAKMSPSAAMTAFATHFDSKDKRAATTADQKTTLRNLVVLGLRASGIINIHPTPRDVKKSVAILAVNDTMPENARSKAVADKDVDIRHIDDNRQRRFIGTLLDNTNDISVGFLMTPAQYFDALEILHKLWLEAVKDVYPKGDISQDQFERNFWLVLETFGRFGTSKSSAFDTYSIRLYAMAEPKKDADVVRVQIGFVKGVMPALIPFSPRQFCSSIDRAYLKYAKANKIAHEVGAQHGVPGRFSYLGFDFASRLSNLSDEEKIAVSQAKDKGLFRENRKVFTNLSTMFNKGSVIEQASNS